MPRCGGWLRSYTCPTLGNLPSVAIIVPCRNEARSIESLLDAILAQTLRPSHVIVTDNGSTDNTRQRIGIWAARGHSLPVDLIHVDRRGAAAAVNAGVRAAAAEIIIRLDGHCRPAPDYVRKSVNTLLSASNAGVVGGVWRIEPGAPGATARGIAAVLSHTLGSGGAEYRQPPRDRATEPRPVDTVPFGTFRRALWERLGGFDESLLRNQDYDFNYRVRRTGLDVILDPAIVSIYKARATFGALARQYFDYGFWKVVMLRKFPTSIRLRQLLPLMLVPVMTGLAVWALIGGAWLPLTLFGAYVGLNLAGATEASVRAGDARLIPAATVALLTLQNAWSTGAWVSLLRAAPALPADQPDSRSGTDLQDSAGPHATIDAQIDATAPAGDDIDANVRVTARPPASA